MDIIQREMPKGFAPAPEDRATVEQYKSRINLEDKSSIIEYGAASQSKMVAFSETVLSQIRNKDLGAVGDTLSVLVSDLKTFDRTVDKPGGFWRFLMSLKKKIVYIKAAYSKIETNVVQVERQLEKHYQTLLKDIHLFDRLYEQNEQYYRDISLYIYAGEEKVQEIRQTALPALQSEAEQTNDPKITQQSRFLEQQLDQLEKKLHDLKLSRMISLQLAPQIRLVQNNSSMLMDKIQSSIVNTLPLWRNQMVLALGLVHSQQAMEAQKAVNEATNKMLHRNSEMLRTSSTLIAQESERSIIDVETLKKVNTDLFATIDDVLKIQSESRQKRQAAEKELQAVEDEFKTRMLKEFSGPAIL
ncbi:MAG: toxic anion resistance protein [Tannerella sp.]|jgi:uncharacterized protein YaaN involved in tellurite resistance|nr:toxic anion resistance protein [Tannerella sp.]